MTVSRSIAFYSAIFFTTLGLLYLEVFSIRIIAIVLNDNVIYYVISLAMLGMGSAGAFATLKRPFPDHNRRATWVSWVALAASGAILVLFLGISLYTEALHNALDASLVQVSQELKEWEIPSDYLATHLYRARVGTILIGAAMFLPYFLLGLVLSTLFRGAKADAISRMYSIDLIGACAGVVLAIIALDYWEFSTSAIVAIMLPFLAAISLMISAGKKATASWLSAACLASMVFMLMGPVRGHLEPPAHEPSLGRTSFQYIGYSVKELWHTWTSYGRIAAIEMHSPNDKYSRTVMVHGSGEGHARVFPSDGDLRRQPEPIRIRHGVELALAGCEPGKVLVLLAGAGADMVLIDRMTEGAADITGVEMVPEVFEWPQGQAGFGLAEFFQKPNIHIIGAEAREFLARDRNRYDCIVFSWPGASKGYFTGVTASAPGYLMTDEGLSDILHHLAPGGQFTMLGGSRVALMANVAHQLRERGNKNIDEAFVVVSMSRPPAERDYVLFQAANARFVMIKPDGFSKKDIERFQDIVRENDLHLIYHPNQAAAEQNVTHKLIQDSDPYGFLNSTLRKYGAAVTPAFDDRPFAENVFPVGAYLTTDFWLGKDNKTYPDRINRIWKLKRIHAFAVMMLIVGSVVLIMGPLAISYRKRSIERTIGAANHIFFFGCLGAAFMFVEMGFIQKLRLLVGHPGHAIAIVLASVIFFTAIGSFFSTRMFSKGFLTFRRAAIFTAVSVVLVVVLMELSMPVLVGLARPVKLCLAFAIPAVPAFLMGQMYPQGLAALTHSERMIPLSMGVNAMTGTIASGLGVALAPIIGFRAVIYLGVAIYLIVAFMPHHVRRSGGLHSA